MSTVKSATDELSLTAELDVKKIDYVTDWDGDERKIVQQVASPEDDIDKAMEMVEGWDRWPMPVMVIIGRTADGQRVVLLNTDVRPYFYVPIEEFDAELESNQKVTGVEHGHEDPNGRNMVRIYTRIPGDVPKLRDEYDHHEADIMFPQRFMIDAGIEDGVEIPVEHATEYPTQITLDEMQPTDCNAQSRVCFCDIEVDDEPGFPDQGVAEQEITSITVYDNYEQDYVLYMYHPDTPDITHDKAEVHMFDNEQDMLEEFILYMHRRRFDIVTGWNFDDFDARYIVNRLDFISELYEDSKLDKNLFSLLGSAYDEGYFGAKVKGTVVFDMLRAYQNTEFSELESYSLDYVAQKELGESKIADNRDLYKIWKNDPQKFADYNVKDVELTVKLEEEQGIIKFYEEIADYVGGRLKDCIGIHNAVDIKILREVYDRWAVPSGAQAEGMDFEGGEVFDPISGIKKNVIVLDLKSLYPMCMKTLNAGINTKDSDGELTAANGVSFSTDQTALVVDIIDELLEKRQKFKDLRDEHPSGSKQHIIYDRKQGAVKVIMNTLYGVLGWPKFRLGDEDVGAAITSTGRAVIKFSEKVVEEMGYEVIYGDTDSIMIELGGEVDKEEAIEIGENLEQKLNDAYDGFAKEEFNADEHYFEMEFEKLYKRYFQAGKKKRYAGNIVYKEGEHLDKLDTVGFETERADYTQVAKTFVEEVLSLLVRGGGLKDLHHLVVETFEKVRNQDYPMGDLGISSSVSQDFDSYDSKTQGVKGAEYANNHLGDSIRPGDKPRKYFIKSIGRSSEFGKEKPVPPRDGDGNMYVAVSDPSVIPDKWTVDWDVLLDKQFKAPLKRVLKGTNWNYNEVLTGDRQPRLREFEANNDTADVVASVEDEKLKEAIDQQTTDEFTEDLEDVERDVLKEALESVGHNKDEVDDIVEANFTGPEGDEYELERFT